MAGSGSSSHWDAWEEPPWDYPQGLRTGVSFRTVRKFVQALPGQIKEKTLFGDAAWAVLHEAQKVTPLPDSKQRAWATWDEWLAERGHGRMIVDKMPLADLWRKPPRNVREASAALPETGSIPPDHEWMYYPLNWCPPRGKDHPDVQQGRLHKSVPVWEDGWWMSWHGSNLYGISSGLKFGYLAPSETDAEGHGTACGRGVYTTRELQLGARYGIAHLWGGERSAWLVKAVFLVAIPGGAGEGGLATWQPNPEGKKGKRWALASGEGEADVQWRLKRGEARKIEHFTEPAWTNDAPQANQESSSTAYPLGLAVAMLQPQQLKHYGHEGRKTRLLVGWDLSLEPPPARPLRSAEIEKAADTRFQQAHKRRLWKKRKDASKEEEEQPPAASSASGSRV